MKIIALYSKDIPQYKIS